MEFLFLVSQRKTAGFVGGLSESRRNAERALRWRACCLAAQWSQSVLPNTMTSAMFLPRPKSGPDYTCLPLIAMENIKFGPGLIRMHDPFRCLPQPVATLLWVNGVPARVDSSVILYLR